MFYLHLLKLLILFDLNALSLLFVFFIPCGSLFLYSFFSSFYVLINYLYDSIYIFALIFNDYLRDFTIMHPWLFRIKLVHLSTSLTMQNFYSSLCLSPFFLGSSSSCYYGHIFYFYLCYKPYKTSLLLHRVNYAFIFPYILIFFHVLHSSFQFVLPFVIIFIQPEELLFLLPTVLFSCQPILPPFIWLKTFVLHPPFWGDINSKYGTLGWRFFKKTFSYYKVSLHYLLAFIISDKLTTALLWFFEGYVSFSLAVSWIFLCHWFQQFGHYVLSYGFLCMYSGHNSLSFF